MRIACLVALSLFAALPSADARRANGGTPALVIPLLTPADDVRQGFARIINHSARAGTVRIYGTDDGGRVHGPVTLSVNAGAAREFSARDLEAGNASKGLSGHLGDGEGSWRLRLESDLDIEAGAYIRTPDGFVASVHDIARTAVVGGETVHRVPIFNPGSNHDQVSLLRLVNLTDAVVDVTIEGRDDEGESALGGRVGLTLPARGARYVSGQQLESVVAGLGFRPGDGRWQLFVTAGGAIEVASLMQTPAGHLTNLSRSGLRGTGLSGTESVHPVGSAFRDCAECPRMVAVPAGSYLMGAPEDEMDRGADEGPVHRVTIAEPFAVGRYEVTFAQWDACHRAGGCSHNPDDQGWGRGDRPVVDVSWDDAQEYVRWLSGETGQDYRLLSESEWEYVARAGTTTRYWWGDEIGRNRANCDGCGRPWDTRQTAPVGSFSANAFGLHDVHGNVWEWVQDCRNDSYAGAPADGSAWESGDCAWHGIRGGSWQTGHPPGSARAANRGAVSPPTSRRFDGTASIGFRVARALIPRNVHALPLFRPAGQTPQGVARIINHSDRAGTVRIVATDDAGRVRGPVILDLDPGATRHFDSDDLEEGNASKGLSGALGDGTGDWRLELTTDLDIEPSAYVRTPDGLLAPMHAAARTVEVGGATVHQVPIFNSGSNRHEVSWLRVANLTDDDVLVTIREREDAGQEHEDVAQTTEVGEVRLVLPGKAARRFSAQQLESGDHPELSGRLVGTGKRRLLVTADGLVTAGGAVEVMSLVQSPAGHLSNLSTMVYGGFEVVAGGPVTVRPLETIHLAVPDGLGDSDYTVLMDLSGTGEFPEDDTVEVDGLTTDDDRILFASPLTQILPETNTSHRLVVQVRREADQATSNVLRYSIDAITSVAGSPGFATMVFETIVKSMYASVDDTLLNLRAASIQPGLVTRSAARLGVDTTFSDVLAEAAMQSLLGMPVTELAPGSLEPPPAAADGADYARQTSQFGKRYVVQRAADSRGVEGLAQALTAFPDSRQGESSRTLRCEQSLYDVGGICQKTEQTRLEEEEIQRKVQNECAGDAFQDACSYRIERAEYPALRLRAAGRYLDAIKDAVKEQVVNFVGGFGTGKVMSATSGKLVQFMGKTRGHTAAKKSIQAIEDANRIMDVTEKGAEMYRVCEALDDCAGRKGKSDSGRDFDKSGWPTKKGRQRNFESHKDNQQSWKQILDELLPKAEKDFASHPNTDNGAQESFSVLVNDVDRRRREVEGIDDLEGVHTGEKSPREAIGNDPRRGVAVAESCAFGYEEFPIDDETSTCVFEALVEPECYAGSRQPTGVDLGGSEVCLYYSRDEFLKEFLPEERCRENYERVYFQGRWTCRWADLDPDQPHWYTLHKALGDEQPEEPELPESPEEPEEPEEPELPETGGQICSLIHTAFNDPAFADIPLDQKKAACRIGYCATGTAGCGCCDTLGSALSSEF